MSSDSSTADAFILRHPKVLVFFSQHVIQPKVVTDTFSPFPFRSLNHSDSNLATCLGTLIFPLPRIHTLIIGGKRVKWRDGKWRQCWRVMGGEVAIGSLIIPADFTKATINKHAIWVKTVYSAIVALSFLAFQSSIPPSRSLHSAPPKSLPVAILEPPFLTRADVPIHPLGAWH